jgi:hypothetical protein
VAEADSDTLVFAAEALALLLLLVTDVYGLL